MKLKLFILLILLNIFIPIEVGAEIIRDANFENISIDKGLSNEDVTCIFQDSTGYMWIGTKDGLNRYDGKNIKVYNSNFEADNTLSSTYITAIEEDMYGNVWIGTDHGLDFLIKDTSTIIRMKDIDDKYNLGDLKITSLLKSKYQEEIIWVGTEDGLFKVNVKNKNIEAFYHDENKSNSLTNSSITSLEEDEYNLLWVGTKLGLNLIDNDSNIYINENNLSKDKLFISDISKDDSGNIWISTKEGIFMYNIQDYNKDKMFLINSSGAKEYSIKEGRFTDIYEFENSEMNLYDNVIFNDSKNNTWISSSNGAIKYINGENKFNIFKEDINFKNSITSNVITCFYEDSHGTIWIGTDKGVNILNDNIIFNYKNEEEKNIVAMLNHNNYVWLATKFKGIYIYEEDNGNLVDVLYEKGNLALSDRYIKSLFEINDDYVVVVTNKGLIAIDTRSNSYKEWIIEDNYSSELTYLYDDGTDIWIASTTDFYLYNIETEEKVYYSESLRELDVNPGRITYILPDNEDQSVIWLGGIDIGLIKYHKEKGIIERYINDSLIKNTLINNYINCMSFDNLGNLWIGTNIGLSKFDLNTEQFTSYTTSQGLTNNFINSILIDDYNNIWISTNKGLNKYNAEKDTFIKFTKMDGLYGHQFNLNSNLKLKNGKILFGSTEGFVGFNVDDLVDYKLYEDKVVIGDIIVENNNIIYDGEELVLEHNYKNLYINVFLPNYQSLNNITYEYMLEGVDSDWVYIDSRSELYFKALDPGKYILKVRARDGHGELTEETVMNIRVKKPIWKTPLAYTIYISVSVVIIIYMVNYVKILQHLVNQKTMKLNKQLEENEKLSNELIQNEKFKNNYFINLSHELRTPINVIVSAAQLIKLLNNNNNITHEKLNNYINIVNKNCNNLLKIINDIIDSSKIETGKYKIYKKNNNIVNIVEETALNMSNLIEEKGISLIIDPDMEEKIISFDETEIERCIINLLANAVKFTNHGGEIRVYIKEVENYIEITIEDTGIGISKEDQEFIFNRFSQVEGTGVMKTSSSGIGLTLVKYIVELHGGYIKLKSEVNKGSSFTIGIPNIRERMEDMNESRALI